MRWGNVKPRRADADPEVVFTFGELLVHFHLEAVHDPLTDLAGLLGRGLWEQYAELIAAVAGTDVGSPQFG